MKRKIYVEKKSKKSKIRCLIKSIIIILLLSLYGLMSGGMQITPPFVEAMSQYLATPTPVPTPVPTEKPTPTPAPTASPTPTLSPTPSPTPTPVPDGIVNYNGASISWIDPEKPVIALTFDDGPGKESADRICNILKENNAHATFFVLGENCDSDTSIGRIKSYLDIGCEIGNHSYSHPQMPELSKDDIKSQEQYLKDLFVEKGIEPQPYLFRPPYGAISQEVKDTIQSPMITWSVDTLDWKSRDKDAILARCEKLEDGDIVLFHEIYGTTADAIEVLVPKLIEEGYQLVTVSELLAYRGIEIKNGGVYSQAWPK